jgi:hypothetical protein
VFYHLTYEGAVNIDSVEDPAMKAAILAQINHFGQTPRQLFPKPHPKRRWVPRPALALVPYSYHTVVPQVSISLLTTHKSCTSFQFGCLVVICCRVFFLLNFFFFIGLFYR